MTDSIKRKTVYFIKETHHFIGGTRTYWIGNNPPPTSDDSKLRVSKGFSSYKVAKKHLEEEKAQYPFSDYEVWEVEFIKYATHTILLKKPRE